MAKRKKKDTKKSILVDVGFSDGTTSQIEYPTPEAIAEYKKQIEPLLKNFLDTFFIGEQND